MVPRQKFWTDNGKHREELEKQDPYAHGCPPEILHRQAEQYAKLFRIFSRHVDKIERVTFWGLTDKESWLNDWPWKRKNYPLLFDRDAAPKPAFYAVVDAVNHRKGSTRQEDHQGR
jgi:endo-1,4-beta-xylanase